MDSSRMQPSSTCRRPRLVVAWLNSRTLTDHVECWLHFRVDLLTFDDAAVCDADNGDDRAENADELHLGLVIL